MIAAPWWRGAVVYQIYPRSFQDSDGDGIGDLAGIVARLDYLVTLGIDAIWISPIFPSPMADFGYDVADYTGIDPLFGTMADFDTLIAQAHQRGLRVLLDFVPNHSSDQHPWFLDSRSSRASVRRDWYIWRDATADGGPPNNWLSRFGGPAWTWDAPTGQYYLHSFLKQQPDLNWRNPACKAAMFDALRFWLEKGVDGFRMDVLWLLLKDDQYRDNPPNPHWQPGSDPFWRLLPDYMADRPETHDVVREMRGVFDEYADRVMIGEIYLPFDRLATYYGRALDEAHLPFNFALVGAEWTAASLAWTINAYEASLPQGAWPNWVLGNHDQHRLATRLGPGMARLAALLLLTLRGTPTIYYGEEIGMVDGVIPPGEVQDPAERAEPGIGLGRNPERTPMQWDGTAQAGFTIGRPWLPVGDAAATNVAGQDGDGASMLAFYRDLLALRRQYPALATGDIAEVAADGDVLRYRRMAGDTTLQVLLNVSHETRWIATGKGQALISTHRDRDSIAIGDWIELRPCEATVIALERSA